jgi:hypothetical protein
MSKDEIHLVVLVVWALVALITVGVWREVKGDLGEDPTWMLAAVWPMLAALAAVVGVCWCLMWLGRTPVRMVRRRAESRRLPRAEVRR